MKVFIKKYLPFVVLLGILALTSPFIKVISQASVDEAIEDGYSHITYDRLSAVDIVWEGITAFFAESMNGNEIVILAILTLLLVIAITQFIASLFKNYRIMLYSSIILFSSLSAILAFIIYNVHNITISRGYYAYLVVQAIVLVLSPSVTKKEVEGV